MSISLIRYFTLALVLVTSLPVTAESTTTSTSQAQDVTQESPRERDRILLKRNPIASEYQEQGRLGLAPGASADSEGVDFRSKFRMKPLGGKPVTRIEPTISYQGTGDQIEPGGRIMLGRQIGGIGAQLQLSTTAATRVISHYQSRWVESLLEGESLSLLGFPRFSQDTYETRNSSVGIRLDAGSDRLQYFYELFASHYTDDAYRNRLEYQVATGSISSLNVKDRTLLAAAADDARLRRYFHRMDTTRDILRHQAGIRIERDRATLDISGYVSRWENLREWRPFNFRDTGVDIAYRLDDPFVPTVTVGSYDLFDLAQSTLANHRPSDLLTTDKDYAFRIDWDREMLLAGEKTWLSAGFLHRTKERDIDHERLVFGASGELPLSEVVGNRTSDSVLENEVFIPAGVDVGLALDRLANEPELVTRSDSQTFIQTLQEIYTSEETVSAGYAYLDHRRGMWWWEAGVRFESTRTQTLGNVIGPPETLEGSDGVRVESVAIGGEILAETFDEFDAYRVSDQRRYTSVLPSLVVRLEPGGGISWRAAVYQQLMRPQYFDIVRYRRVNPPTRSINEGNPLLEPTVITNFALAGEMEAEWIGTFGLEIYRKEIKDFFYDARSIEVLEGVDYDVRRVENGKDGTISGFQLQWRRDVDGLMDGAFDSSFSFAYTWSDSTAAIEGREILVPERSRHLVQSGLELTRGKWRWSTQFSWQSRALDSVGAEQFQDIYREEVMVWNNTVSLALRPGWSARLQLVNLVDFPERSVENDPVRVANNQYSDYSLTASLSIVL